MLERVWRKGNPLTLLVGMQTRTISLRTFPTLNSESRDVLEAWDSWRKGEMQKQDDRVSFIVLEMKKEEGQNERKGQEGGPEISNWKEKRKGQMRSTK